MYNNLPIRVGRNDKMSSPNHVGLKKSTLTHSFHYVISTDMKLSTINCNTIFLMLRNGKYLFHFVQPHDLFIS